MQASKDSHKEIFNLKGKVALVTGGVGILGREYCQALAEFGATVILADLDAETCRKTAEKISADTGAEVEGYAVDLSSEQSLKNFTAKVLKKYQDIDILINNAGAKSDNFFAPLESFPLEDWNQVMNVNVTAMFLMAREIGSKMAERGKGSIINVSSIYGVVAPDQRIYEGSWYEELGGAINTPLIYSASKGAVISMTKYLATYWGAKGVRTNTITPGGVTSGQNSTFSEKYSARVPMGRMAVKSDMVGAILFLASEASSYVNGQNIIVDGGLTAW